MAEIEELRTQPQDIQAEQSVLGAIFIDEGKRVLFVNISSLAISLSTRTVWIFKAKDRSSWRGDAIDDDCSKYFR